MSCDAGQRVVSANFMESSGVRTAFQSSPKLGGRGQICILSLTNHFIWATLKKVMILSEVALQVI